MSNFTLKQDGYTSYTTIPNCFIEQYMPYAAGEFVKMYIYLLKCVGENKSELSISRIADVFNNTEKDVVRAMKYWERKGLLKLTFDEENTLTSLRLISFSEMEDARENSVGEKVTLNVTDAPVPGSPVIAHRTWKNERRKEEKPEKTNAFPEKKEYSRSEILEFSGQEEIRELFFIIQKYLGRPLTGQDTNTVLFLLDELKFSCELIEYLFEYCVSRNHKSIRYIEKTALAWAESGIKTVKAAKTTAGIYSNDCYQVLKTFGLNNRKPTESEMDYVSRWTLSYGFDINLVVTACKKTMAQLHQPSFEYTDAILQNWKSQGVTTLEDVQKLDEAFEQSASKNEKKQKNKSKSSKSAATRFNNFQQREYDYTMLEQKLFAVAAGSAKEE